MDDLEKILSKLDTPCYILDLDSVRTNIQMIKDSISYPNFQIHYAIFCNDNAQLLQLLKSNGIGILVLNENELKTALRFGFLKEEIHLTGGTFTRRRLDQLLSFGIDLNLDSLAQLELAGHLAKGSKVGIRIRLSGETKGSGEGISLLEIEKAKNISDRYGLKIIGIHTYIGTNILDEQKYLESAITLTTIASEFPGLRYLNIGGGFGIPYSDKDKSFNWVYFGRELTKLFEKIHGNNSHYIQLKIEPGRSIVGNAGYFITKVIELRDGYTLVVDAPYTNFARPFVYHINNRVNCIGKNRREKIFKIRGCTINSNDYLSSPEFEGDVAVLPKDIQVGDILCFRDVGAYSPVMQMDFLHNNVAPTILIREGKLVE